MFTIIHHKHPTFTINLIFHYSSSSFDLGASHPGQRLLGALATEREEDQQNSEGPDQEGLDLGEGNYLGKGGDCHLEGRRWERMEVDLLQNHQEADPCH